MHLRNRLVIAFFIFGFFIPIILQSSLGRTAQAAEPDPDRRGDPVTYTDRGADTCLKCHDEDSKYPVLPIFKTKHAQPADERTPFAKLQCETCHGPGAEHVEHKQDMTEDEGERNESAGNEPDEVARIIKFGPRATTPPEKQNRICLDCHENKARMNWGGSAHDNANLSCANCHRIHAEHDRATTKTEQPEVCFACHKKERVDVHKVSAHPIRQGQMACSECHNPHGSTTKALLVRPTLNETCYTCHAEKRGPLLWEHAPVAEDCTNCHTPHGSIHPALLTKRAPLLCQQCHSQAGHPSVAYTADGLPPAGASPFLLGKSCLNCHSQVHGSNHPSGVKLSR